MFEMQIKIDGEWKSIKKTGAEHPYQYSAREEAERMLDICYPDQRREDRLDGFNNRCRVVRVNDMVAEPVKFVVGDIVTGSDPGMKRWSQKGEVTGVEPELNYHRYFVRWDNGDHREHHANELKAGGA